MLGGLIQDDVNESTRRVPYLSAIPVLGNLFKSKSDTRSRTNLLVFLRPTVIRSRQEARDVTDDKFDGVWEVEINSRDAAYDGLFNGERPTDTKDG